MNGQTYTPEQMNDAKRIFETLASIPPERRYIVILATESFINGMVAQERLDTKDSVLKPT